MLRFIIKRRFHFIVKYFRLRTNNPPDVFIVKDPALCIPKDDPNDIYRNYFIELPNETSG